MDEKKDEDDLAENMSVEENHEKLMDYEMKRWIEEWGYRIWFKKKNKYQKLYEEMTIIYPDNQEGTGVDKLEELFLLLFFFRIFKKKSFK